jgi:hypothetical protein
MADKIYRITLSDSDYDTYDSAIIQCESLEKLNELIDNHVFDYDYQVDHHFEYARVYTKEFKFDIHSYQRISSIEELGTACKPIPEGYVAAVLCSSFNAG